MQLDEYGIYDIYPLICKPFWQTTYFKVAVGVFLGSLLLGGVYLLFKKYTIYRNRQIIPTKLVVLQRLENLKCSQYQKDMPLFYADLGFVLRLFLTDTHGSDMLSYTESELLEHFLVCTSCVNYGLVDKRWQREIHLLLDRMSSIKYQEKQIALHAAVEDLGIIAMFVTAVYVKK